MLLQESCPNQHICHPRTLCDVVSESFTGTDCTQDASLFRDGLGCCDGGGIVPDGVEYISQLRAGGGPDLVDDVLVAIVKDVLGAQRSGEIMVTEAAGGDHIQTMMLGDLNGVLADASCAIQSASPLRLVDKL